MAEARRNVQNLLPVIPAGHVSKSPEKGPARSGMSDRLPAEDTGLVGANRNAGECIAPSIRGSLRISGKCRGQHVRL